MPYSNNLAHKYYNVLDVLSRDKHSSLFCKQWPVPLTLFRQLVIYNYLEISGGQSYNQYLCHSFFQHQS